VDDGDLEAASLLQLGAGPLARDDVVGLGADAAGSLAAQTAYKCLRLRPGDPLQRPREYEGPPREGTIGGWGSLLRLDAHFQQPVDQLSPGSLEEERDLAGHAGADPLDGVQLVLAGGPQTFQPPELGGQQGRGGFTDP